jgi:hypothetical protein
MAQSSDPTIRWLNPSLPGSLLTLPDPATQPTWLIPGGVGTVLTMESSGRPRWLVPPAAMPAGTTGALLHYTTDWAALGAGTADQVLTMVGGLPTWAASTGGGMVNPMVGLGDLIQGGSGGTPQRLAIGPTGNVLTVVSGAPAWAAPTGGGMNNPMLTVGDLIKGESAGTPVRLAIGTPDQVLTVVAGAPAWATLPTGAGNPMTATGDMVRGAAFGTPERFGVGAENQVLTVVSGIPAWAPSAGGAGGELALATFDHGKKTAIGQTPVALSATSIPATYGVWVEAPPDNTGRLYVGNVDVTPGTDPARDGWPLDPGESTFVRIDNVNKVFGITPSGTVAAYWRSE